MSLPLLDGALQIFDVDHGQCALLTVPNTVGTYRALIDCGHAVNFRGAPWYPGAHLQSLGVDYIDLLVCTNFDEDHVSGYPDLRDRGVKVCCILGNPTVSPDTIARLKTQDGMGYGIETLVEILRIRAQLNWAQVPQNLPANVSMWWTWNPYPYFDDENNLSLVFTVDVYGFRFMFPGDLECDGWRHMLATYQPFRSLTAGVHVLVASHHGRQNGICEELFDVCGCRPEVVVISDDHKQHDTQETTDYYGRKATGLYNFRGCGTARKVLTTRSDSEIRFRFASGQCFVS